MTSAYLRKQQRNIYAILILITTVLRLEVLNEFFTVGGLINVVTWPNFLFQENWFPKLLFFYIESCLNVSDV